MDDGAPQTLHGGREGAAGAGTHLVEHGGHHLTLNDTNTGFFPFQKFHSGIHVER